MSEPPSRELSDQARPLAAALIRPQQRYPSPPGQEARGRERRRTPLDCDILSDAVSSASIVDENITYAAHGNSPRPEAQDSSHDDVTGQGDLDIPDADSSNRSPSRSLHLPPKASQQNQPTASNAGCNDSAVSYSLSLSIVSQLRTPSHSPHNWLLSQEIPSQPPRRRIRSVSNIPNNIIALRLANPEYQLQGLDTVKSPRGLATFQCRLCPKRFTRAYHLRSHLRTHTERPFVCTICGKSFARQHDRKQHEGLHSGEKVFVCRGDLSDGNPWGCGRRFATVDALGRHFQSEAGRVCLKSLWDEENCERNQGKDVQEHPTNLKSCPSPSEVFTLPVRLLEQYPALAQMN
ncbi:hypothetical protein NPX13_g551 [Xylaria arbuscula]|uniref:C2H2-type domain-containing protein n=1 Tax=Xylaria arbuscula TaxID=114810 RepID=A0A9W8TQF2_9PEZI|nr:hypothetical protein NPX13_g551 [Xylaria arbuscula]